MKVFVNNNYDYEDEKLYSTGDHELDELLERAFCEGYDYAQKEFAEAEEEEEEGTKKHKKHTGAKVAAGAAALGLGGIELTPEVIKGLEKLAKKEETRRFDKYAQVDTSKANWMDKAAKQGKSARRMGKIAENLEGAADKTSKFRGEVNELPKKAVKAMGKLLKKRAK